MIVLIHKAGKSFKGLATYLTHDPKAKSDERVGWTHTLNLAHDHVGSAVGEMMWTSRSAELLKQEAGVRAGGRATENTAKHVSLNWSPEEAPTPEHMIETTESFLRHMGWHEHQALVVSHEDKPHPHVHVMLNTIHPETGLRLDDNFERRRAQAWALNYERENGRVFCEQRLKNADEREAAPTRPAWMAFQEKQAEFERDEKANRDQTPNISEPSENPKITNSDAWKKLKEIQRLERLTFFAEGKLQFSELRRSVYQEVREEYRERWAELYTAQKNTKDAATTAALKKELIAEQKEVLEAARDQACTELRENRNALYQELLDDQRDIRQQLRWRQEKELDNAIFLRAIAERDAGKDRPIPSFRDAAEETLNRPVTERGALRLSVAHTNERSGLKSGADVGAGIATGLGFGLLSIFGGIADGVTGSTPALQPRRGEQEPRDDPFDAVIEQARKQHQREAEEASDEYRRRQRSDGE